MTANTTTFSEMATTSQTYVRSHPDPSRKWRYLTVRTSFLFGKNAVGRRLLDELHRQGIEHQSRLDNTGLRWVWRVRAYLTEQEHADLCRRFNAKERKR